MSSFFFSLFRVENRAYNETPMKGITMTFKSAMSSVGNGLLTGVSAIHNASIHGQITVLDDEILELEEQLKQKREEKTRLEDQLI